MRAQIDEQCVIKANSQFWEQMLAMTLDPVSVSGEFCVAAGHVMGSVNLGGVWKGRIEVRMAEGLALPGDGGDDDAAAGDGGPRPMRWTPPKRSPT
jgi:hypothetical protein